MAHGYIGSTRPYFCRCCKSGPKQKFFCQPCDHVVKAPWAGSPVCPTCRKPMLAMGDKWRPGKKGSRSLEHSHQNPRWLQPPLSPGEMLLRTLERSNGRTSNRKFKRRKNKRERMTARLVEAVEAA